MDRFAREGGLNSAFSVSSTRSDLLIHTQRIRRFRLNPITRTEAPDENHSCTNSINDHTSRTNAKTRNSTPCLRTLRPARNGSRRKTRFCLATYDSGGLEPEKAMTQVYGLSQTETPLSCRGWEIAVRSVTLSGPLVRPMMGASPMTMSQP